MVVGAINAPHRQTLALLLVAALFAMVAIVVLWLRHSFETIQPPAPSPAAFARSAPVRQADETDVSWIDDQFAALAGFAPWLTDAGRSVLDECSVAGGGSLVGGIDPYQFSCTRTDTRYYAYGGSPGVHIQLLRQALNHLGWTSLSLIPSTQASTSLPVISAAPDGTSGLLAGKAGLQFSWTERNGPLNLGQQLGAVSRQTAPQRNTYIETMQPSIHAISSHLTPSHPYLLIVQIAAIYAIHDVKK
ncbi:MAG: hypothetical protein J2P27_12835 [Actinobacteria bacterium]|nr:hypothetical protein [Actinomycetota bacterium]